MPLRSQPFSNLSTRDKVVFLDDDPEFLDTLETVFEGTWRCAFYDSRQTIEPVLTRGAEMLEWERSALADIAQAQSSATDDPNAMLRALQYFHDPRRLDITAALVVDFAMPGEDGISFCARNGHVGLQRMLLTGIANEAQAVGAFNEGNIERFMPKQRVWGTGDLDAEVALLIARSGQRRSELLKGTSSAELRTLLERPGTADALRALLAQHGVVEYILLGVPPGLVCVHADGSASWVQLDTESTLKSQLEAIESEPERWADGVAQRIASGACAMNMHCVAELGVAPEEAPALDLLGDGSLRVTQFRLDLPAELRPAIG